VTDQPEYDTFDDLVSGIGAQVMESIRLNAKAYTVSTLEGARRAFSERITVLLRDVGYGEILGLMVEDSRTASLALPEFSPKTMGDAIHFTVASHIYRLHSAVLADYCFKWAEGDFLKTLERCADTAEKVVSLRRSRDMKKMAEFIRRTLARFEHEGEVPAALDVREMINQKTSIFGPAMNDEKMDWASLNSIGIDRPLLFELKERMNNYLNLSGIDHARFLKLVSDEITARWPKKPAPTSMEESNDR
jgi:hypothetical protein